MNDFNLILCDDLYNDSNVVTYRNLALNQYFCIDHFIVDANLRCTIVSVDVVDSGINLSDHVPFFIKFNHDSVMNDAAPISVAKAPTCTKYRWDKADINSYYLATSEGLSGINISDGVASTADIDLLYDSIVHCLQAASAAHIPRATGHFYKFWWMIICLILRQSRLVPTIYARQIVVQGLAWCLTFSNQPKQTTSVPYSTRTEVISMLCLMT